MLCTWMLASPPGSNTRVVSVAFSMPGAVEAWGSFKEKAALPSASSWPLNASVFWVVNSVAGLLKTYCPYLGNWVFTLLSDISILVFKREAVAPVSQAEEMVACTSFCEACSIFPGSLTLILSRLGFTDSMRRLLWKVLPPTLT